MGLESDDIDVSLDDISGTEFAKLIAQQLTTEGYQVATVDVIKGNSDKSKHLETATLKINDMVVDFVQLRKETYF